VYGVLSLLSRLARYANGVRSVVVDRKGRVVVVYVSMSDEEEARQLERDVRDILSELGG